MELISKILKQLFILISTISISSCSLFQPSPLPNSEYLSDVPGELVDRSSRSSFERSWADEEIVKYVGLPTTRVRNVVVSTAHLKESTRWRSDSFEDIKVEANRLAELFEARIRESIENYPSKKVTFLKDDKVNDHTVDIEVSIIELVPQAVVRKVLSTGFGFFSGLGSILGLYGDSVIAIEGKLIRSSDGKILAAIADRHAGKFAPIDLRVFSKYRQAEENIREWSNDISALLNTTADHKVKGESVITLLPW